MHREIKFRAWDGDYMILWDSLMEYNGQEISEGVLVGVQNDGSGDSDIKVMQYTGFTDVNLKEYFEGDLCSNNLGTNKETIREIRLEKGSWQMVRVKGNSRLPKSIPLYERYRLNMPIVGNIYENPELLEV